jgi:hypothetical protein
MRLMMSLSSALLLVAAFAAAQDASNKPAVSQSDAGLPFESVARGNMSGVQTQRQVTVRTTDELQKLWKEHSPDQKMPAIDFSSKMLVGVFLGSKPSEGYSVEIINVRSEGKDGKDLVVEYAQKQPGRGMMAAQILIEPYHLVSVAKHLGAVRFVEESKR